MICDKVMDFLSVALWGEIPRALTLSEDNNYELTALGAPPTTFPLHHACARQA
jgi:hypothetical protein